MDYRLPLPHVPRLYGYAFELSVSQRQHSANITGTGMGVSFISLTSRQHWNALTTDSGLSYFSISVVLNTLLTLMIVIRLTLYSRNVRAAMGMNGTGGLYKAIVTMLVESFALYAVNSLLFIGSWGAGNDVNNTFLATLAEMQVCAFPWPRSSDTLSDMMDWTGHRSIARHSTRRQQERVDGSRCCLRTKPLPRSKEPRGVARW